MGAYSTVPAAAARRRKVPAAEIENNLPPRRADAYCGAYRRSLSMSGYHTNICFLSFLLVKHLEILKFRRQFWPYFQFFTHFAENF